MIENKLQDKDNQPVLQSQLLLQEAGIEHFFSLRRFENAGQGVWMPRQVHGTNVVVVDEGTRYDVSSELQDVEADAVITNLPGRWIGVRTADCVPVLLYDPVLHVVAAVHAGWRGTVKHIVGLTVERMNSDYGCQPTDLLAMVGPSIGPESFEVGEEVVAAFVAAGRQDCVLRQRFTSHGIVPYPKPHVDLWQSNVMDLMEAGLELERIDCTPVCTFQQHEHLFSARRQGIETGRIVSAIRIMA